MLDVETRDGSTAHCWGASLNGAAPVERQPAAPAAPSDEALEKLVAALDRCGESAKAAEAGMEREALFELARRVERAAGPSQALKEAAHAAAIARDVIADADYDMIENTLAVNLLKQLAGMAKRGDLDAGAKAVDAALAVLQQQEEHCCQSLQDVRKAVLEAGLKQDLLRRDFSAAAQRIEAIAALDAKDTAPSWSPAYWRRLNGFMAKGEAEGINLPLEIAIAMARRMVETAQDAAERAAAFVLLGNAQRLIGMKENGTERLAEAAASYREALKASSPERRPIEWASTQLSLGAVLAMLGEREDGTVRLEEAVAAYQDALREQTRERGPLQWATAQVTKPFTNKAS